MSVKELKMVTESICKEVIVIFYHFQLCCKFISHFSKNHQKVVLTLGEADNWACASSFSTSPQERIVVNESHVSQLFYNNILIGNSCHQLRSSKQKGGRAPIGLNSLSKTFNVIRVVGEGIGLETFERYYENSSGHFGKVFKVENKFDHRMFALKQIKIHPKEDLDKVLKEVENLSKVNL